MNFKNKTSRIYLSPPHMSQNERELLVNAFDSNWIAPLGPMVNQFEKDICNYTGAKYALALSSGTAAIHLALIEANVQSGDDVFVSSLTFVGSVNPICYVKANPVFIDSAPNNVNIDIDLLEEAFIDRRKRNKLPKVLILVHLYGHSSDLDRVVTLCNEYGVMLIEDSAESLGTFYKDKHTGIFGKFGVFSFNGNKIITTSGGGMLVSNDEDLMLHAKKLSTQAREPFPYYQHEEIGFNYRMSNLLAAVGIGQLSNLEDRVASRRANHQFYTNAFKDIDDVEIIQEPKSNRANHWLTILRLDPDRKDINSEAIRLELENHNIESRPVWKPMHLQPIFKDNASYRGIESEKLFKNGLCLPSGSSLSNEELSKISQIILDVIQ